MQNQNSEFKSNVLIGLSDGLLIPFALAAGLSNLSSSGDLIILAGGITAAVGAITMTFGGYLTHRQALKDQEMTGKAVPGAEDIDRDINGTDHDVHHHHHHQSLSDIQFMQVRERPGRTAITIGISYLAGGLVPLIPYLFYSPMMAFRIGVVPVLCILFLVGWQKNRITGGQPLYGGLFLSFTGLAVAAAAFAVSKLFLPS